MLVSSCQSERPFVALISDVQSPKRLKSRYLTSENYLCQHRFLACTSLWHASTLQDAVFRLERPKSVCGKLERVQAQSSTKSSLWVLSGQRADHRHTGASEQLGRVQLLANSFVGAVDCVSISTRSSDSVVSQS